ncbi:hypothetical protein ACFPRL_16765 [Pseudoclavibacter helvolus]
MRRRIAFKTTTRSRTLAMSAVHSDTARRTASAGGVDASAAGAPNSSAVVISSSYSTDVQSSHSLHRRVVCKYIGGRRPVSDACARHIGRSLSKQWRLS